MLWTVPKLKTLLIWIHTNHESMVEIWVRKRTIHLPNKRWEKMDRCPRSGPTSIFFFIFLIFLGCVCLFVECVNIFSSRGCFREKISTSIRLTKTSLASLIWRKKLKRRKPFFGNFLARSHSRKGAQFVYS